MTEAHRQAELENARKEWQAARERLSVLKVWGKAKKEASEQVEFWSNKVSFLSAVRGN